jgi:glycosyltransferase involved in cell wall biosynthesis
MTSPDQPILGAPSVSLVVATVNRVAELERLLASLEAQTYQRFEVIVVDQNPDDRLAPVLRRHPGLAIRHLRSELGVSRARNAGLRSAQGDITAFPDDDCWYPQQLLAGVVQWLEAHPDSAGVLTGVRDEKHQLMAPKFPPPPGPCTKKSVFRCAVTFNAFLRASAVKVVGDFREDIGPGTPSPYQSGEDLDYMIRVVECGLGLWYQPQLTVHHRDMNSPERRRRTTYPYALGLGYILRLHEYSWWVAGNVWLRSLAGAAVHLCKGNWELSYLYLRRAVGEFRGYVFCPASALGCGADRASRP